MGHRHWFAFVCLTEMCNVIFSASCGFCGPENNYWDWEVPGSLLSKPRHSHLALLKSLTSLWNAFLQVSISQAKPWQSFWFKKNSKNPATHFMNQIQKSIYDFSFWISMAGNHWYGLAWDQAKPIQLASQAQLLHENVQFINTNTHPPAIQADGPVRQAKKWFISSLRKKKGKGKANQNLEFLTGCIGSSNVQREMICVSHQNVTVDLASYPFSPG